MSGCCSYAPKRRVYQLRAKLLSIDLHAGLSNWPSQSPKARLALDSIDETPQPGGLDGWAQNLNHPEALSCPEPVVD